MDKSLKLSAKFSGCYLNYTSKSKGIWGYPHCSADFLAVSGTVSASVFGQVPEKGT